MFSCNSSHFCNSLLSLRHEKYLFKILSKSRLIVNGARQEGGSFQTLDNASLLGTLAWRSGKHPMMFVKLYWCKCSKESREGIMLLLLFFILWISFHAIDYPLGKEYLGNFSYVLWPWLAGVLSEERITVAN